MRLRRRGTGFVYIFSFLSTYLALRDIGIGRFGVFKSIVFSLECVEIGYTVRSSSFTPNCGFHFVDSSGPVDVTGQASSAEPHNVHGGQDRIKDVRSESLAASTAPKISHTRSRFQFIICRSTWL